MEKGYSGFVRFALGRLGLDDFGRARGADADGEFALLRAKWSRREARSRRAKITVEVFAADGAPTARTIALQEFVPPASGAYISSTESGGARTDYELVAVGENRFVRENEGAWRSDDPAPPESYLASYAATVSFVGETALGGRAALVYLEKKSGATGGGRTTIETRYWFTADGELLKTEAEETNETTGEKKRVVIVYEDDPNIKIEAPVI